MACAGTQEYRIAGVDALDPVDLDILDCGAVHSGDRDGAAVGVVDLYVLEFEVLELTSCVGSELDAIGARSAHAILH